MSSKDKLTAVEWFYDKIKSHFEHDRDLKETIESAYILAITFEIEQHGRTWDAAIQAHEDRGHVLTRSLCDFDDYNIR